MIFAIIKATKIKEDTHLDVNNLVDKAKDLAENVPGDVKGKASGLIEEAEKHMPEDMKEKAWGILGGIKDKLGL
ncbi:MAG: hypothetical protein ACLSXK_05585 [Lactococcus petauri]